jgi:hypothetical protein
VTDLHPDLEPYVVEDDKFGARLTHPLVSGPHAPEFVEHNNRCYLSKREAVAKAAEDGDWESYVFLYERPYRLDAFLRVPCDSNDDAPAYYQLMRNVWVDTEAPSNDEESWENVLPSPIWGQRMMMDESERAALAALTDPVPVFRGFSLDSSERGFSWTVDRQRADWFAHRFACLGGEARVVCGTIAKAKVVAYLLARGESEVLALPEDVTVHEVVASSPRAEESSAWTAR